MTERWVLHDHAIMRSTGFAWSLLNALDHPRTAAALTELDQAETRLAEAVTGVVDTVRAEPAAVSPRQSRRLRKALHRHAELPAELTAEIDIPAVLAALDRYRWRLRELADATRTAESMCGEEAEASHKAMLDVAADPAVREALWLSSPAMHDRGLRELADAAAEPTRRPARKLRRQFGGYLQRLAAKNETTSFFGPINYAEFGSEPTGAEPVALGTAERRAALAYWAVLALADAAAVDPAVRPHLRPRRSGLLTSTQPVRLAGRAVELPPDLHAMIRAADGDRSIAALAAELGRPAPELRETVEQAVRRRLLLLDCRPPVTVLDPLDWLRTFLAELPGAQRWTSTVDRITASLREFEDAELARRRELLAAIEHEIAAVSAEPVRRGGGAWYADRLVLHEECLGDIGPLALGTALADSLRERLTPALNLLAAEGVARHALLTSLFLDRYPELASGSTLPLLRLLRSPERLTLPSGPLTAAGRRVAELADHADPDQPLWIDPDELPAHDLGGDPLIASPDLMFDSTSLADILAGRAQIVLAECHDTMLIWGWALQFHPRRELVERAGADLLRRACADTTMAVVRGSRRAKIIPFDFPGPTVDLGSTTMDSGRVGIPIADVGVRLRDRRLVCTAPGIGDFLLHHGELDSDVHNVLAPPRVRPVAFGSGRRTPRLVLGDVVLARARWNLDRDELFPRGDTIPDELTMLRHARRAAAATGLPRRTFLKVPGERKPVLLDLQAPALLDLGWQLSTAAAQVELSELLPGPDGLWLRGRDGRHCAELRITLALDRTGSRR